MDSLGLQGPSAQGFDRTGISCGESPSACQKARNRRYAWNTPSFFQYGPMKVVLRQITMREVLQTTQPPART